MSAFEVRGQTLGTERLFLIAGPCVIEEEALTLRIAHALRDMTRERGIPFVFKASFDKANRTSLGSFRGPGMEAGLRVLARVREETGAPVLTDVHSPEEARKAAPFVDILQIPAFLSRQTDLLLAAAQTGLPVNAKKAQFLAPHDMGHVVAKLEAGGCRRILLTERGASFGYNNLVVDMRSIPIMTTLGHPVVFDATHSVQLPGGLGAASGGERRFVAPLARAAVAAGAHGIFLETHENPDAALCDGPNSLPLGDLPPLLDTLLAIHTAARA